MRVTSIAKAGIGLAALALLSGALTATTAVADPTNSTDRGVLVGVGSDTTQDLMNGISSVVGGVSGNPRIASYNATDASGVNSAPGETITTRPGGSPIDRPNGSGAGVDALLVSIGQNSSITSAPGSWTTANTLGQVDFARSSSGPSVPVVGGVVTYVPYARDAVDYAVSSGSLFPPLSVGNSSTDGVDGNGVGNDNLYSIYSGQVTQIASGSSDPSDNDPKLVNWSYVADTANGETLTPIHAYVPQAGSGTRKFWDGSSVMNITEANVDNAGIVWDEKVTGGTSASDLPTPVTGGGALSVEEHNGTVLQGDPGAIMPFSVGKWIADADQLPGVVDARNGAVLGDLGGDSPTLGSGTSYSPNPAYFADNGVATGTDNAVTRLVYNVIPTAAVSDQSSLLNWAFVGTGSLICSQTATISEYGFEPLTATSGSSSCGDTSRQAFAASPATVTLTSASTVVYGAHLGLTANVTSVGNGGGTIVFSNNGTPFDTETIPAGSSTSSIAVAVHGGDLSPLALTAVFTPNLDGVAVGTSAADDVTVTKGTALLHVSAPSLTHTHHPVVTFTVSAAGFTPTGSIEIKSGSHVIVAAAPLVNGVVAVSLPKVAKGSHKYTYIYSGDVTTNAKSSTFTYKAK